MLRTAIVLLSATTSLADASEWQPPENPDPDAIHNEAKADARAGRYEDALAKHVWFHEHALEYQRSQYGVRLSFALSDWRELGEKHPPALKKMRDTRDETRRRIVAGQGDTYHLFNDFEALNERLDEPEQTVELFLLLREESPETARRVYRLAEEVLFEAGEYAVCGEYLDPDSTLRGALRTHNSMVELANEPGLPVARFGLDMKERELKFADSCLAEETARIIVLLIRNDREEEANEVADKITPMLSHQEHLDQIESALRGEFAESN